MMAFPSSGITRQSDVVRARRTQVAAELERQRKEEEAERQAVKMARLLRAGAEAMPPQAPYQPSPVASDEESSGGSIVSKLLKHSGLNADGGIWERPQEPEVMPMPQPPPVRAPAPSVNPMEVFPVPSSGVQVDADLPPVMRDHLRSVFLNESPAGEDRSFIPIAERRDAILKAAESPAPSEPSEPSALPGRSPAASSAIPGLDELDRRMKALSDLLAAPVENRNSRWKGAVKVAVDLFTRGLAGGGIGGGVGSGVAGLLMGLFDKNLDERLGKQKEVSRLSKELEQLYSTVRGRMDIERDAAAIEAARAKSAPGATDAKSRAALMRELKSRMSLTGGRFNSNDARSVEIAQQLDISPQSSGSKFNWQSVRTLRGSDGVDRAVQFRFEDGQLRGDYIDVDGAEIAPMSERDQKTLALMLERENRERGRYGMSPVQFGDNQPAPSPPASAPAPAAPAPRGQPSNSSPVLVPVPGAKPIEPPRRYGRGGGYRRGAGRGSSGGNSRDLGFAESGAAGATAQAEEARARAASYRDEGKDDLAAQQDKVAAAWEEKARVENERAVRAGGRRHAAPATTPAPQRKGKIWSKIEDPLGILD